MALSRDTCHRRDFHDESGSTYGPEEVVLGDAGKHLSI